MQSDYGMLLARTDFSVPKHNGISWFAFKLDQPGVTIRPLREMTGDAEFNEVFIDDAVCDAADLIGGEGNGWAVTQTTLFFERSGIGAGGSPPGFPCPGRRAACSDGARRRSADPVPGGNLVVQYPTSSRSRSPGIAPAILTSARSSRGSTRTRSSASGTRNGPKPKQQGRRPRDRESRQDRADAHHEALGCARGRNPGRRRVARGSRRGRRRPFHRRARVLARVVDLRRHRRDPAQHHRRTNLGPSRDDLPGKGRPYGEVLRSINERA